MQKHLPHFEELNGENIILNSINITFVFLLRIKSFEKLIEIKCKK